MTLWLCVTVWLCVTMWLWVCDSMTWGLDGVSVEWLVVGPLSPHTGVGQGGVLLTRHQARVVEDVVSVTGVRQQLTFVAQVVACAGQVVKVWKHDHLVHVTGTPVLVYWGTISGLPPWPVWIGRDCCSVPLFPGIGEVVRVIIDRAATSSAESLALTSRVVEVTQYTPQLSPHKRATHFVFFGTRCALFLKPCPEVAASTVASRSLAIRAHHKQCTEHHCCTYYHLVQIRHIVNCVLKV